MRIKTDEQKLKDLEAVYVAGQQALRHRNQLILEMLESGVRQAEIYRIINQVRSEAGAKPIGRDAVFMLAYRNRRK